MIELIFGHNLVSITDMSFCLFRLNTSEVDHFVLFAAPSTIRNLDFNRAPILLLNYFHHRNFGQWVINLL